MKRLLASAVLLLACTVAVQAADAVSIRGTLRTLDKSRSTEQQRPGHAIQSEVREQALEIELKVLQPVAATNVRVSWVVLVESPKGRTVRPAAHGSQLTNLNRIAASRVLSDPFALFEREVKRKGRVSEVDSEVFGWGVRVDDLHGNRLAERVEPVKAAADVRAFWERGGKDEDQPPNRERSRL